MNVKLKERIWKFATLLVVIVIILNPEMVGLALFIDGVGLEMFIVLLEVQALALLSAFLNIKIATIIEVIKSFYKRYFLPLTWEKIKEKPERLVFFAQSPAILMSLLVFSAAADVLLNVYK